MMRTELRHGLMIGLGLLAVACVRAEDPTASGLGFRETLRLGALEGDAAIPAMPMAVVFDMAENVTLFTSLAGPTPLQFDAAGEPLGELGRFGRGPGEFLSSMVGEGLPGDSLLVYDLRGARASVIGPDDVFRRSVSTRGGQITQLRVVAWPDTVLVVAWPLGRPGSSFELVSMVGTEAAHLVSFGEPWPTDPNAVSGYRRYAAHPRDGTLWTADGQQYRLVEWSLAGDSIAALKPRSAWFEASGMGSGPDSIPPTQVRAVERLRGDTLAVGLVVARDGWEDAWEGIDVDSGEFRAPSGTALWDTVVEFRSATSGELLGSQRLPGVVFQIFPDGRVATHDLEDPGYPIVRIFSRDR